MATGIQTGIVFEKKVNDLNQIYDLNTFDDISWLYMKSIGF